MSAIKKIVYEYPGESSIKIKAIVIYQSGPVD